MGLCKKFFEKRARFYTDFGHGMSIARKGGAQVTHGALPFHWSNGSGSDSEKDQGSADKMIRQHARRWFWDLAAALVLLILGFSATEASAAGTCGTELAFVDRFNSASYCNNDGTLNWATCWTEIGESDGASAGYARIDPNPANGGMFILSEVNRGVWREVNLSGYNAARLEFMYGRYGLDDVNDYTRLEISANGATGPWVELDRYAGPADDSPYSATNDGAIIYDITPYISSNTRIRFRNSSTMGWDDLVTFEHLRIDVSSSNFAPAHDHFRVTHDGSANVGTVENVTITAHNAMHATYTGYTGTIALSTSTVHGDWVVVTGNGTLNNGASGDGAATYTFVAGDNGVVILGLDNTFSETLNINVVDGTCSEGAKEINVARLASASATHEDAPWGEIASNANDGIIDGWIEDWTREWAYDGTSGTNAALTLTWSGSTPTIDRVVMYDRKTTDRILGATLSFSSGSNVSVGSLIDSGAPTQVTFSSRTISWMTFTVTSATLSDVGLMEIQAFGTFSSAPEDPDLTFAPAPMQHFAISHDGSGTVGIAEPVTFAAHNASHGVFSTYTGTVNLSTSTSHGDWVVVTGSGTLNNGTAGDGAATYTFVAGDNGDVVLSLTNTFAETLNINVSGGGFSEAATEDANLVFSAPPASCFGSTFCDEFNNRAYNGNDGLQSWATSWTEIGESDGATLEDEQVLTFTSNYQLRVQDNDNGGEGVWRGVNLSGYTTATLSFAYWRSGLDDANDYVRVEISANGAAGPWTELTRFQGSANDSSWQTFSQNISAYISANTRIRFLTSSNMGSADAVYFDAVAIDAVAPDVDHFAISHDGSGIVNVAENVTIAAHKTGHVVETIYIGTITLSTSTGHGNWAVVTGSGTLNNGTVGDGVATYTFVLGDSGDVVLSLTNTIAETLNINVTDGTYSEDASEDADLVFGGIGDCVASTGTVYYVRKTGNNSNSGLSPATAWQTIQKAATTLAAGDVACVGGGSYDEAVAPTVDGTAANPIRFIADTAGAYTGDAGDVIVRDTTSCSRVLYVSGDDYLHWYGFMFNGSGCSSPVVQWNATGGVLSNCEVWSGNTDGIYIGSGSLSVESCISSANGDDGVEGIGGTLSVKNSLFDSNNDDGIAVAGATLTVWHATSVDNTGDGVFISSGSLTLRNSVLAFNSDDGMDSNGGVLTHTYNDLYGNTSNFEGASQSTGEITMDPRFVNRASGDYHLQASSSAIDAGTDGSAVTVIDFDGDSRPQNSGWDMGMDEFVGIPIDAVDHFDIDHDNTGIHCVAETITVTAEDLGGGAVTDYTGAVTLDTQSGEGTWSLLTGNGSFSDGAANDGLATYTFADADNGVAVFRLSYEEGSGFIDVDVYESGGSPRDDDTEGNLTWYASGFTVTASALPNPPPNPINDPIASQTAGTAFNVHIAAYGTTATDTECGIIESYTGSKSLKFWSTYQNPASGTVRVTVNGTSIATAEGSSSAQSVGFTNGQALVSSKYKDVGQIRISLKDDTVPISAIRGATNSFVVLPDDFVITAITDASDNPNLSAADENGPVFAAAGDSFKVTVEVQDAEGSRTPNYGNESIPEGILLKSAALIAPLGGRNGSADNGTIGNGTLFSAVAPAGTFRGDSFSFDEVGIMRLQVAVGDGDYLGAGDVPGTGSENVGRFIPDHFDVSVTTTPRFATQCETGVGFTYLGDSFGFDTQPVLTVTAKASTGMPPTTTRNYTGDWWKMDTSHLTGRNYAAATGTLLDTSGLPLAAPAMGATDPVVFDSGQGDPNAATAGTGTLTFSSGSGLFFTRGDATVAPFAADISLSINVIDGDDVSYEDPIDGTPIFEIGDNTAGNGIAFSTDKEMRYGRVALQNAHGSELQNLPVPLRAEYWNGSFWVLNTDDSCSSLGSAVANLLLTRVPVGLATSPSPAMLNFSLGDAGLTFSAPGAGNTGYVDIEASLSAAGLSYLLWDWDGDGSADDNPSGRATFGIYRGSGETIFMRENY